MPAFGSAAFVLGRLGRRRAGEAAVYRLTATAAMVLGGAEVLVGIVLAVVVLVAFATG